MQRKIIPDIVGRTDVATVGPETSVSDGAALMRSKKIAALIISNDTGGIAGIVTERDLVFRVLAERKEGSALSLGDVMTADPDTLAPDDRAGDALAIMQDKHYRHLPVVDDGKCVAVVSIRDLFAAVQSTLEENLKETEAFVFGDRYGE